jgi:hypothetical protein
MPASDGSGRTNLLRRPLTETDGPEFAHLHGAIQRPEALLPEERQLKPMALIEVNHIHAQTVQRPI